jgi:hypothetical protein
MGFIAQDDPRTEELVRVFRHMIAGKDVWVWSKLGHWIRTRILEIRGTGTVIVCGLNPGVVLSFEPGQIRLEAPPEGERRGEIDARR